MSCAVFTILGAYTLLAKKSNRWALWATFGAAVAMFFVASFLAWRSEHRNLLAAQATVNDLTVPKFTGVLGFTALAPAGPNKQNTLVTLEVSIENVGAPSIAKNFEVFLHLDGSTFVGQVVPIPRGDIKLSFDGGPTLVLDQHDFLPSKAGEQPIPNGGARNGFLIELFPVQREMVYRSSQPTVEVTFDDVKGKPYKLLGKIDKAPGKIIDPNKVQGK